MAIVPVHKAITKDTLGGFGFVPAAITIAVEANAAVDKKQGDDASETNLHAMRGYFIAADPVFGRLNVRLRQQEPSIGLGPRVRNTKGGPLGVAETRGHIKLGPLELIPDPLSGLSQTYRLQTEQEAKDAVETLLREAKRDVIESVLKRDYAGALTRLGEALHTVQDRVFHHFEPWPYKDIPDSLMKSPNYMMCHALRDLGYISKIGVDEHQFALGVATRVDPQLYLGTELFGPTGSQSSMTGGFRGWGGMVTLSFGAAPGSMPSPDPRVRGDNQPSDDAVRPCLTTEGVADKAQATDKSTRFIAEIKEEITAAQKGGETWDNFVHLKQSR